MAVKRRRSVRKRQAREVTRKRRAVPPAKGARTQRRPHVAMLGNPEIVTAVREHLDEVGLASLLAHNPGELLEATNDATRAVLIAPPLPDVSVADLCADLASVSPRVPVFTAIRATLPWKSEKELYEAGASAVFLWPKERESLLRALISLVHDSRRATSREPRDLALRHRVRRRIKSMAELDGCRLDVRVIRGVAVLTGSVDHLWQAESAANLARSVPGVQDVVSREVRVRADETTDREIAGAIRKVIRATSGLDPTTIAIEVDDGSVVLAGTVDSPLEHERVCSLIHNVRGVKSLASYVTVSRDDRRRDKALARQVDKAVALRYPRERIRISAFGGIVVLRGIVGLAETREALRSFVAIQPGVQRVVNKLTVRRSSGRRGSG